MLIHSDIEVVPVTVVNGNLTDSRHFVMTYRKAKNKKQKTKQDLYIPISKTCKSVTTLISMQMVSLPLSPYKT